MHIVVHISSLFGYYPHSLVINMLIILVSLHPVPDDLTPEEKQELENIRRRKQELLEDIQVRFLSTCFIFKYPVQQEALCTLREEIWSYD